MPFFFGCFFPKSTVFGFTCDLRYNARMKLFILLMLVSHIAFGRDCLKESWNLHAGMKFTYSINDLMDKYEAQKKSLSVCDDKLKNEMWDSEQKALIDGHKELQKEFKSKGDISSEILAYGYSQEQKHLTHTELCVKVDEKVTELSDCYLPRSYIEKMKSTDFASVKIRDFCKKNLPLLYNQYQACRNKK